MKNEPTVLGMLETFLGVLAGAKSRFQPPCFIREVKLLNHIG